MNITKDTPINDWGRYLKPLLYLISKIVGLQGEDQGAFLLLRYQNTSEEHIRDTDLHVISCIGASTDNLIKELSKGENSFAKKMLVGYKFDYPNREGSFDSNWTGIGATKENDEWKLQDHSNDDEYVPFSRYAESRLDLGIRRFYFLRICNWNELNIAHPQAVIVLYDKTNFFFDVKLSRYFLSLKKDFSTYIELNFTNDAYKSSVQNKEAREKAELIQEFYEQRFDKFKHGARTYIDKFSELCQRENVSKNELLAFNSLINSNVKVGQYLAEYFKGKHFKSQRFPGRFSDSESQELIMILSVLKDFYGNDNEFGEEVTLIFNKDELAQIESIVPYKYLRDFILECLCNAFDYKAVIELKVHNGLLSIISSGKIFNIEYDELMEHLESEHPVNAKFGIGLFVIYKIIKSFVGIAPSFEISNSFTINIPYTRNHGKTSTIH